MIKIPRLLAIAIICTVTFPPILAAAKKDVRRDAFEVYLNSRGPYVSGKSVAPADLPKLARKSRAGSAVLSAEPDLPREKIREVVDLVKRGGVQKVKLARPKSAYQSTVEKFQAIFERQEGDVLAVYLNSRSAYINGKSVSAIELPIVIRHLRTKEAVLTYEPELARMTVAGLRDAIRDSGVKKVKLVRYTPAGAKKKR